jgi:hypothetical protein
MPEVLRPAPPVRPASRIAPALVPGLDLYAGRFDAGCTVCGRRPCSLLVRDQAAGEAEQWFFCPAHERAAEALYETLAA